MNDLDTLSVGELFNAYEECLSIKKTLGEKCKIVSGFESTKQHFLTNANKYNLIHLAMHGSGDNKSIKQNHLYFRGKSEKEITLNSDEIENLNFNTKLLVLNSCQANSARTIVNQGNFSMARSFACTGVSNIVTSNWSINDGASSQLITNFYQQLLSGHEINEALCFAKRSYLSELQNSNLSDPYYWSSHQLYIN